MTYVLWIIQALLGLLFLFSGAMKFIMPVAEMTKDMPSMPGWFLHFIGVMERRRSRSARWESAPRCSR